MVAAANDWTQEDEDRLLELDRSLYDAEPLAEYIDRINPKYPVVPHLHPLIELLERTRHESVFAVVSMPPRHRKTTTCANFLAWSLEQDPAVKHGYVTFNHQKSRSESKKTKGIAEKADAPLDPRRQAVEEWFTLAGGSVRATSVNGGLTGEGITGVLIIDDPVKDRKEADSDQRRQDVWEWFTDVALTRMEPGSSIIIVQTRWHEDDLAGRVLRGDFNAALTAAGQDPWRWEHINLPALCVNEADGTGRKIGEALWPEAYPVRYLALRRALNPWSFEALYQQDPKPRFGRLFEAAPARYLRSAFLERGFDGCRLAIAVDPAASANQKADQWACVAMAVMGEGADQEGWILDVDAWRSDPIEGAARVRRFYERWGSLPVGIEGGVAGKSPIASLRRQHPEMVILELPAERDKWTRAQPAAAAWNAGRLAVPLRASWAPAVLRQANDFTGLDGGEDDIIDAIAHAWNLLTDAVFDEELPPYGEVESHAPAW